MTPGDPAARDEIARDLAREILARDEFARWRGEPTAVWRTLAQIGQWMRDGAEAAFGLLPPSWRQALRALWEWLRSLVDGADTAPLDDPWLRTVLWLALAGLLLWLAVQTTRALRAATALSGPDAGAGSAERGEAWSARARRLAGDGRYLEAAHCVQLAALALLLERGWIELAPSEPNRTLRRRLAASRLPAETRSDFARLLDELEQHWFRDRRDDRGLYEAWLGLHGRLGDLGSLADRRSPGGLTPARAASNGASG